MAAGRVAADTTCMSETSDGTCPNCLQGDVITISIAVSERDLTFSTCHLCEAKWWYREGELVPLSSVIDLVVKR